jgi:predicted HAD superfamily phosphohydrolase
MADKDKLLEQEKKALLDALANQVTKSKAELVADIETSLSELLGMDVKKVFDSVAAVQQIRGGAMNLDRTHKSTLVLLAYVLNKETIIRGNERGEFLSSHDGKVQP